MGTRIFLPGCFDVLHVGHVRMIREAATHGEVTILLNSDTSVRALKGETRPINNEWDRAEVLRALRYVTRVKVFDELTPVDMIRRLIHEGLKPDVLMKGEEYRDKPIPEREVVEGVGGRIEFFPMSIGHSTTRIVGAR